MDVFPVGLSYQLIQNKNATQVQNSFQISL